MALVGNWTLQCNLFFVFFFFSGMFCLDKLLVSYHTSKSTLEVLVGGIVTDVAC